MKTQVRTLLELDGNPCRIGGREHWVISVHECKDFGRPCWTIQALCTHIQIQDQWDDCISAHPITIPGFTVNPDETFNSLGAARKRAESLALVLGGYMLPRDWLARKDFPLKPWSEIVLAAE